MTSRQDRTAALVAAAKAKSGKKTDDAEQAIRRLLKRGDPVTFQAVQREAGVSHAFLYNHPDLRARIERLRANTQLVLQRHSPSGEWVASPPVVG
jgi:Zn-dependent protease with chaperone function